ncbi:MAG: hypothetical protein IT555_06400 [Acetobacteraceae bacterium]|nr:hypothetical protein [Acetobacteraceae bacterium]
MATAPAVVVHSLADATAALAEGCAVTLLSAEGAGVFAGAGWWRALVAQARAAHAATPCDDVLDCADAPGAAMAAIRAGQGTLVLDPACPAFGRIAALARVLPARPAALDLGQPGARHRLPLWLARRREDDSTAALR